MKRRKNLNDEEIVLELIEVRQTQEHPYLSVKEMSEDIVKYIGQNESKEEHPVTISVNKKLKQYSVIRFFKKK